jgi:TolA-binding protein
MKLRPFTLSLCLIVAAGQRPVAAQANFQQAVQDYNTGKYGRALSEFKDIEATYPTNALTHYYIALCQQSVGHIDQARQEFQWVIANGPEQLKSMAHTGLNQLTGVKTQVSSTPLIASASMPTQGSTAPKSKVRTIYEFYADW